MDKALFDQIIAVLLPEMDDPAARKALIESALFGSPILQHIQWDGAARPFTMRLVRQLTEYGEIASGHPALVALLVEVKGQVGMNRQAEMDALNTRLQTSVASSVVLKPPAVTLRTDLYVFISYARPQQALAEQIETYLQTAGVRVFRDTNEIREGANWDRVIEQALRDCQRMVLLLSPDSMPYSKEVHREWFYFDQKRKPIYPLYVADCDLPSRIYAYNHIDARSDLQSALGRLLKALGRDFDLPSARRGADKVNVFETAAVETRSLPEALQALLDAVRDPEGGVVLSLNQATAIKDHKPHDLTEYRLGRIAEWSLPHYAVDNSFVNLTLLLDKDEESQHHWQAEDFRFNDLRDVLMKVPDPALVLLGAPGSGKTTLLQRFQMDHSLDQIQADGEQVTFFIPLISYQDNVDPREWLNTYWTERYPSLPTLDDYLRDGRMILLLDALNEMPHKSIADYHEKVMLWRTFTQVIVAQGNRAIFSCRSLDYSATLSSKALHVPQIVVQPLINQKVKQYLKINLGEIGEMIFENLVQNDGLEALRSIDFLKRYIIFRNSQPKLDDLTLIKSHGKFTSILASAIHQLDSDMFGIQQIFVEFDKSMYTMIEYKTDEYTRKMRLTMHRLKQSIERLCSMQVFKEDSCHKLSVSINFLFTDIVSWSLSNS